MARWVVAGFLIAGGALALGVGGLDGLIVFLVLAVIVGAVAYGAATGGEWIRDASARRFRDRDRR